MPTRYGTRGIPWRDICNARGPEHSSIDGSAEAPINAVALIEQAVEGTESDVFRTARAYGAKTERFIFRSHRLNPFFEGIPVAGEFGHGNGRKSAVQKFVVGINAFRVEILSAEFAGQHQRAIHNSG
jgi:hypothetical protein